MAIRSTTALSSQSQCVTVTATFSHRLRPLFQSSDTPDKPHLSLSPPVVTGVTLKMAFDANWGVANLDDTVSERFTSPESLDLVHRLRRASHAVLVGRGTVERDDCTLTVRRVPLLAGQKQPLRVVVDPNLRALKFDSTPLYKLLHDGLPTLIYHTKNASVPESFVSQLSKSVSLVALDASIQTNDSSFSSPRKHSTISAKAMVEDLRKRGIHHVMVEGGPVTARVFLQEQMVDRAILIRAPMTFSKPLFSEMSEQVMADAGLQLLGTTSDESSGGDVVEYWSRRDLDWPTDELAKWPP